MNTFLRVSAYLLAAFVFLTNVQASADSSGETDMIASFTRPADFFIKSIQASSVYTTKFNAQGLPSEKVYTMKACLADTSGSSKNMSLKSFDIYDRTAINLSVQTNQDGCLYWVERFQFDAYTAEHFATVNRVVVDRESAPFVFAFTVNPWTDEVRYNLSTSTVKPPLDAFTTRLQ